MQANKKANNNSSYVNCRFFYIILHNICSKPHADSPLTMRKHDVMFSVTGYHRGKSDRQPEWIVLFQLTRVKIKKHEHTWIYQELKKLRNIKVTVLPIRVETSEKVPKEIKKKGRKELEIRGRIETRIFKRSEKTCCHIDFIKINTS